jgi:predicted O-methyltransferase YrrM
MMRARAINAAQRIASVFGLRLAKAPAAFLGNDADIRTRERFFPVGRHEPWVIPPDLAARTEAWARTLVGVYSEHSCWPGSIAPEAGQMLHTLVLNIRPRTIVETGTFMGVSSIWMASALRRVHEGSGGRAVLHAFDLFGINPDDVAGTAESSRERLSQVRARFASAGVADLIEIHQGDSAAQIRANAPALERGVELAYIDGDHSERGVTADLHAVEPYLPVGGYVVLHDTFPEVCSQPGPRWLIDNLGWVSKYRYQVCELYTAQTNYGLALMRRVG